MPRVLNKRHGDTGTYVGRPTKWGNPYGFRARSAAQFTVATREEAVTRYREWIVQQPELMNALPELRGKDLLCWCAPLACHASVLLELANQVV